VCALVPQALIPRAVTSCAHHLACIVATEDRVSKSHRYKHRHLVRTGACSVCTYVRVWVYVRTSLSVCVRLPYVCTYVWVYVSVRTCVCVCMLCIFCFSVCVCVLWVVRA